MEFEVLEKAIDTYRVEGKSYFTTSSFQTHSLVLLHMLARIDRQIPVVFINTGYHFAETIEFRDEIMDLLGMENLVDLRSTMPKSMQMDASGRLLYTSDPDHCCFINKTEPLDAVLRTHDIWINGVRAEQSATRGRMQDRQKAPHGTMRLHPMLDWTAKQVYQYRNEFGLPAHPLEDRGYLSVGCEPCTRRFDHKISEREARWYGTNKVECGLHTDLISQ